jgi:tetratricopeptide (TPR) repeat protein
MYDHDFGRSVAEAQEAIKLAPYDGQLKFSLVDVLIAAGRYYVALQWLDDAKPRYPGRTAAYEANRGLIYRLQGNYEQSVASYRSAGDIGWSYSRMSMAISLYHLGQVEEAKALVRTALKDSPDFTQALWRSGSVYSDPTIHDREVADLGKLGLPEK